jgi:hypothetical protein
MAVDEESLFPTLVDPFSEDIVELVNLDLNPNLCTLVARNSAHSCIPLFSYGGIR